MTTVYVSREVTDQDDELFELELAAEVSADGEVIGLQRVLYRVAHHEAGTDRIDLVYSEISDWALRQIDMRDLAEDVRRRLRARERGWP